MNLPHTTSVIISCLFLAACVSAPPASNELFFDFEGDGHFTGTAGFDFTDDDIKGFANSDLHCGGKGITEFSRSETPQAIVFSGKCG